MIDRFFLFIFVYINKNSRFSIIVCIDNRVNFSDFIIDRRVNGC